MAYRSARVVLVCAPLAWMASGACGGGTLGPRDGAAGGDGAPSADGLLASDGTADLAGGADARDGGPFDATARPDSLPFDATVSEGTECHDLPNTAPFIAPQILGAGAVPPQLRGGTITDARYELVAAEQYPGYDGGVAQSVMHRTVEFQQGATRWLVTELIGAGSSFHDYRLSFALIVGAGGDLLATYDACAGSSPANQYRYEATSGAITMWFERTGILLHYLRAP